MKNIVSIPQSEFSVFGRQRCEICPIRRAGVSIPRSEFSVFGPATGAGTVVFCADFNSSIGIQCVRTSALTSVNALVIPCFNSSIGIQCVRTFLLSQADTACLGSGFNSSIGIQCVRTPVFIVCHHTMSIVSIPQSEFSVFGHGIQIRKNAVNASFNSSIGIQCVRTQ